MPVDDTGVYRARFTVPPEALDANGHVNNVVWVQWMQDHATAHSDECGGSAAMESAGGTWVARSHHVDYLAPAVAGDEICVATWVLDFRRASSRRRYRFTAADTGRLLVLGETHWVFIDRQSLRPRTVPPALCECFVLQTGDPE